MTDQQLEKTVLELVAWIKKQGDAAGVNGAVFGVSGGVDSALILALAKRAYPDSCLGLILPCHSLPQDQEDAIMLLKKFDCPYIVQDLSAAYDALVAIYPKSANEREGLALANIKPRLRMTTLYYHANLNDYIVLGTGNRDEIHVGYCTKYGDGGVDILPLGRLTKGEVRELARYLGVPPTIVGKPPSAGLWEGQTDEDEMGLTYRDIDAYLQGLPVPEDVKKKIERRHASSEHKRRTPPIPNMD